MKKFREIRISITFFILFLALPVIFIKTKGFSFGIATFGYINVLLLIFITFFWIASFPLSIYHLIRAISYQKMLKNEYMINWNYERTFWISFVVKEAFFRFKEDLLFYIKLGLKTSIISLIAAGVYILISNRLKVFPWIILIVLALYTIMVLWCFVKNIVFIIENMIFSNGQVIGTKEGVSFNGEYHYWHSKSNHRLLEVGMEDCNIVIHYLVSIKDKDVRTIRIPIPEES